MRACVRACVRVSACVCACVHACVCVCELAHTYQPSAIGPMKIPTRHQASVCQQGLPGHSLKAPPLRVFSYCGVLIPWRVLSYCGAQEPGCVSSHTVALRSPAGSMTHRQRHVPCRGRGSLLHRGCCAPDPAARGEDGRP